MDTMDGVRRLLAAHGMFKVIGGQCTSRDGMGADGKVSGRPYVQWTVVDSTDGLFELQFNGCSR